MKGVGDEVRKTSTCNRQVEEDSPDHDGLLRAVADRVAPTHRDVLDRTAVDEDVRHGRTLHQRVRLTRNLREEDVEVLDTVVTPAQYAVAASVRVLSSGGWNSVIERLSPNEGPRRTTPTASVTTSGVMRLSRPSKSPEGVVLAEESPRSCRTRLVTGHSSNTGNGSAAPRR